MGARRGITLAGQVVGWILIIAVAGLMMSVGVAMMMGYDPNDNADWSGFVGYLLFLGSGGLLYMGYKLIFE
jgi:hypothetical protein